MVFDIGCIDALMQDDDFLDKPLLYAHGDKTRPLFDLDAYLDNFADENELMTAALNETSKYNQKPLFYGTPDGELALLRAVRFIPEAEKE